MSTNKVRVTLVRSPNGEQKVHHATLQVLGLGKIGTSSVHVDSPSLRGMLRKVAHLVRVEPAPPDAPTGRAGRGRLRTGRGRAMVRVIPRTAEASPAAEAAVSAGQEGSDVGESQ